MPKILTVGSESFDVPLEGEVGNYGESLTDFFSAVSDALGTVQQRNDIPITTAAILNNATSATNVPGFSFDTTEVISINCEYIVRRNTTTPLNNLVESGNITGNFTGSSWAISVVSEGFADIVFDITPSGQITYKSSDLTGSNYTGQILFKAKVFNAT